MNQSGWRVILNSNRLTAGRSKLQGPECDAKLWWACNLQPTARAKQLADFATRHALDTEAKQWSKIAGLLE